MARSLLPMSAMTSSVRRTVALLVFLFSVVGLVPALSAQPVMPRLQDELNRTDAIIRDARAAIGDAPQARELLRNAVDHQNRARALFNAGRPAPAGQETMLARRLAERALNPTGTGDRQDIERVLRRMDQRVSMAGEWLRSHPEAGAGWREDLATAQRQLDRAWQAFRGGQNDEALKHAATVRQILGDFPSAPEFEGGRERIQLHLDATDHLIETMSRVLPQPFASRLDAAREAQRRARERLRQGRPGVALGLALDARAHAIRIWNESGSAPDRPVTEALIEANRLAMEEIGMMSAGGAVGDPSVESEMDQARRLQADSARNLHDDHIGNAWTLALDTSRHLWNIRQRFNPGNGPGLRRR